ncbi:MAG TPA: DEAD/DEAH box helicase [Bacteroidetes bacterium]|nr:DEAD/DEAH box helicase [Bacteroidota bacterium]
MKFEDFKLRKEIMEGLEAMGYTEPTPIQEQTIPAILEKKDLIGCAQTGTGKTAAYLLPVLHHILEDGKKEGIDTLIIAPTRELTQQIDMQLQGLAYFTPVSSIAVYGGGDAVAWEKEKRALEMQTDMVVATPGKLLSYLNLGILKLDHLKHLVLDEADRMLDMGFYDDIVQILTFLPRVRQNLLFSATMPSDIRKLAKKILYHPVEVNIAPSKPAEGVLEAAYFIPPQKKIPLIRQLLQGKELQTVLMFTSTKRMASQLEKELKSIGLSAKAIHSDLTQPQRDEVLRQFRNRNIQLLVATDLLSRGIDIVGIDLVVNFNVPRDPEDYIHRVGRTARAKASGVAITLVEPEEKRYFSRIEHFLEKEIYKIPVPRDL